jgi:hypothetical protein
VLSTENKRRQRLASHETLSASGRKGAEARWGNHQIGECSEADCDRPARSRGLCSRHYATARRRSETIQFPE